MTPNRSLDEFGTADAGPDRRDANDVEPVDSPEMDSAPADGSETDASPTDDEARDETPAPVASTYAWSPAGGPCAACGERVEERWREGDSLVCVACKDW